MAFATQIVLAGKCSRSLFSKPIPLINIWISNVLANHSSLFFKTPYTFQPLADKLFDAVTTRYMRMASAQFLKDFRRAYQLKKTSEHRKRVLQRQQVATVRKDAIPFERIVRDNSPGKQSSHRSLRVFVEKHGASGLGKIYKKDQLVKLCRGYGVVVRSTHNKIQLSNLLLEALNACPEERIPYPFSLGNLESTTETNSGRLILRIRRV